MSTQKLTKTGLALSFIVIFAVVFSTLTILQVLGLGSYAPFAAGAVAALASVVLSVLLWKPRNQSSKPGEMSKQTIGSNTTNAKTHGFLPKLVCIVSDASGFALIMCVNDCLSGQKYNNDAELRMKSDFG